MKYLIFLISLLVSACACTVAPTKPLPRPTYIEIHADTDFTQEERRGILEASRQWYMQTGGLVSFRVVFDGNLKKGPGVPLVRAEVGSPSVAHMDAETHCGEEDGGCVLAYVNTLGGIHNPSPTDGQLYMVVVDRALGTHTPQFFTRVVMHEFGHLLGMAHLKDPYALMMGASDSLNENLALTRPDLAEYCRVNECP